MDYIFLTVWATWAAVSAGLLFRLRVFSPRPLREAPSRESDLSLLHLGMVFLLYLGGALVAVALLNGLPAKASTTAPASSAASAATAATAASARGSAGSEEHPFRLLAADCIGKFIAALVMLALAWSLVKGRLRGLGVDVSMAASGMAKGMLAMFILAPYLYGVMLGTQLISEWIRVTNGWGPAPVHPILKALQEQHETPAQYALLVGSALIVAPFVEELFFRGFLQTILIRLRFGWVPATAGVSGRGDAPGTDAGTLAYAAPGTEFPGRTSALMRWAAIGLASALFASIHLSEGNYEVLPPLFVLAVALGYVYERTGNLWSAMTVHFLFNAVSVADTVFSR